MLSVVGLSAAEAHPGREGTCRDLDSDRRILKGEDLALA